MAKKTEYGEDFRYLVRISSTDLDGKLTVAQGLTGIKGISDRLGYVIVQNAKIDQTKLMGDLSDEEIALLQEKIDSVEELVPAWMRNRQNDPESGDDAHQIGSEIDLQLRDDLNRLKKIRSWKGLRHEANLPVRGQRTRANGRTGLTVGVQRKKE